ncbi:MAG: UDP-2,3-diacylglucosamine diphosphatase [Gemmatimonadales bacterium]
MPAPIVTIIVSDAHLGEAPEEVSGAFRCFVEAVPDIGDHLIINGDLFDFWFEYRHVIPKAHFAVLSALGRLGDHGVKLTVMGGNHDRWGAEFWDDAMGGRFYRKGAELNVAGWRAWITHGDGLAESDLGGRLIHRIVGHPLTAAAFRWLHPDIGFSLVRRMSGRLGARRGGEEAVARAVAAQARFAAQVLDSRPELDLLVLGHTHRPVLHSHGERRWYLNPGAWMDGYRYAIVTEEGPELRAFISH